MYKRFTETARSVVVMAEEEAGALGHNFIGTEHVLLGLLAVGEDAVARVALEGLGLTTGRVRDCVVRIIGRGHVDAPLAPPPGSRAAAGLRRTLTPLAARTLEFSLREALDRGDDFIGTEHLLLALARHGGEGIAAWVLRDCGVDQVALQSAIGDVLGSRAPG